MKTITVKELEERIEEIIGDYDRGDDTVYRVETPDGRYVMFTPYDGPYTETVKEKDGEMFVELPPRLLAKNGWDENTKLNMELINGAIQLCEDKPNER